jgi:hypothetical protein
MRQPTNGLRDLYKTCRSVGILYLGEIVVKERGSHYRTDRPGRRESPNLGKAGATSDVAGFGDFLRNTLTAGTTSPNGPPLRLRRIHAWMEVAQVNDAASTTGPLASSTTWSRARRAVATAVVSRGTSAAVPHGDSLTMRSVSSHRT